MLPRPRVTHERLLHLDVGTHGKLATLDTSLSGFAAFTPSRVGALEIIGCILGEVRQLKTTFEEHGADGRLLEQLTGAFRALEHIASAAVVREVTVGE